MIDKGQSYKQELLAPVAGLRLCLTVCSIYTLLYIPCTITGRLDVWLHTKGVVWQSSVDGHRSPECGTLVG